MYLYLVKTISFRFLVLVFFRCVSRVLKGIGATLV